MEGSGGEGGWSDLYESTVKVVTSAENKPVCYEVLLEPLNTIEGRCTNKHQKIFELVLPTVDVLLIMHYHLLQS